MKAASSRRAADRELALGAPRGEFRCGAEGAPDLQGADADRLKLPVARATRPKLSARPGSVFPCRSFVAGRRRIRDRQAATCPTAVVRVPAPRASARNRLLNRLRHERALKRPRSGPRGARAKQDRRDQGRDCARGTAIRSDRRPAAGPTSNPRASTHSRLGVLACGDSDRSQVFDDVFDHGLAKAILSRG